MSGKIPSRVMMTRTQRNTPSKAGKAVPKNAITLCNGSRSRRAMCNYIRKRTHTNSIPDNTNY